MRYMIRHEIRGRIRFHIDQKKMTCRQAEILLNTLSEIPGVTRVKVYERTCDAVVCYSGSRDTLIAALRHCSGQESASFGQELITTGRELNDDFRGRLVVKAGGYVLRRLFLPAALRAAWNIWRALHYVKKGIAVLARRKLEVEVLDATAISVSLLRGDFDTAGSVMFLLGIGELLEDWTHKKSVNDLARSMSLQVDKVWKKNEGREILVPIREIREGDRILVCMGNVIPLDGLVETGEGMVNQASMTGESEPVRKGPASSVYAGTVVEEGELTVLVRQASGSTRYEKIVRMIEDSEKLKSSVESKAQHLADALVPYSLGGTALTYLLTRNVTKALSILMVDFSCALKLAMPIAVLSAMREASNYRMTVKGGKYMEAAAEADVIVFDKTGTLTKAKPRVREVIPFHGQDAREMLRLAACLEEHFPHSMANAVVNEAVSQNLEHEEIHTQVNYIVAHGIASTVSGQKVIIGSHHFVFEDEQTRIPEGEESRFEALPDDCSQLYLAIDGTLAAVILIEDPLREEAAAVIRALKKEGIRKVVMMTGDSERTAAAIARKVGVDEYYSEVLPEDKAGFIQAEKARGSKVIMIGDGINDSPALSAADVGIAISEGAAIAREIADITVSGENLEQLLILKRLSNALMERIHGNYRTVIGFNLGLILLGVAGILPPAASALLHNTSTLAIGMKSMTDLL